MIAGDTTWRGQRGFMSASRWRSSLYAVIARGDTGSNWGAGGGGSAMGVTLVSNVPLPANPVQTQSVLATESKGLSKSQPKPVVGRERGYSDPGEERQEETDSPSLAETQRKPQPQPVEEANNVVPYGEGGPVSGPTVHSMLVRRRVDWDYRRRRRFRRALRMVRAGNPEKRQQSWLAYEVDPRITRPIGSTSIFDIGRERPSHERARRAVKRRADRWTYRRCGHIQRIDTFGPLPSDYSGSKVSVEFWFDYKEIGC